MLQTLEYILIGAIVVLALALICDIAVVTARKRGVPVNERDRKREADPSAVKVSTVALESKGPKQKGMALYGTALTLAAFVLTTLYLAMRWYLSGHGPFANQHEFAVSFVWGALLAYLIFEWRFSVRMLSLVVLPFSLAMLLYAMSQQSGIEPLIPALQNNLLLPLHVTFAILAYGAACVSFAAAVLYLLRPRLGDRIRAYPSARVLDELGYKAAVITFPLLTLMILLGAMWANVAWGKYWSWDPKETAALVTWFAYGAYLHARVVAKWRGKRAAWLLVIGFITILIAYFGNHFFGGLHSYGV